MRLLMDIDGMTVTVVRKRIKNLYLTVSPRDGAVRVSAPAHVPDAAVLDFVRSKADWIARQQARLADIAPKTPVPDGQVSVWGRPYSLCFAPGQPSALADGRLRLSVPQDSTSEQRHEALTQFYRAALHDEITRRLPVWEAITGLYCAGWQIRDMKTRWGSCTPGTKKLRFSLALARRPLVCLDYVLLHELAHLQVPNHGSEFTALLDRYMPNCRDVRALLNGRA